MTFLPDVRWACGFTGSNGALIVTPTSAHFVTDGRYRDQAAAEVREARVHVATGDLWTYVRESGLLGEVRTVLFQAEHVPVSQYRRWTSVFPEVEWKPVEQLVTDLVAVKRADEIEAIMRAQAITEGVYTELLEHVRPGVSEMELAAEVVYQHLRRGAARMAFHPIVASGPNAALPHARPTPRRLQKGDAVVLDFGCVMDGYASDMTRTVFVESVGSEERRVYQVVREAQEAALEVACAGMRSDDLDRAARDVVVRAGYGDHFTHSLGHGVGLQTHEWPRVSSQAAYPLPNGCVVTIEPGVYLPGRFGVRIEDMIVLGPDGSLNLTSTSKDLLVL